MPCPHWLPQRFWQHPASMFLYLGAEPFGREYPGASSARTAVDAPNVPDAWPLGRLTSRPSARRARAALGERVAYRERPNVLRPNVLRCVGFRT